MAEEKTTTIRVRQATLRRFRKLKRRGESDDATLSRLLQEARPARPRTTRRGTRTTGMAPVMPRTPDVAPATRPRDMAGTPAPPRH